MIYLKYDLCRKFTPKQGVINGEIIFTQLTESLIFIVLLTQPGSDGLSSGNFGAFNEDSEPLSSDQPEVIFFKPWNQLIESGCESTLGDAELICEIKRFQRFI